MDDQSLRESFTEYGEVIEARIIHDRETGRSRGFGFVSFTSNEEAASAITGMDGKDLHGRLVHVNYATERTGGFRSGGGGYGGGGYSNDGYGTGGGYSQNDGYGTGGGYSQNDGNASGGSYSQSQNDGYGISGSTSSQIPGAGDDGISEGRSPGGTKDDYGYDDNVGNMGKGY